MSAEDRNAWVQVARATLSGIPGDLLQRGCKAARERCKFPSEIVPTILEEVKLAWKWRREAAVREDYHLPPPREPEPGYVDPQEVRQLIKSLRNGQATSAAR